MEEERFHGITYLKPGVQRNKDRWRAQVCLGQDIYQIGTFPTAEIAARVYDVAAVILKGPDARLNFDGQPPAGITVKQIQERIDEIERNWNEG